MTQENTYNGIIGFFDILGYQNLLEKNEPDVVAQKIIPILVNLKEDSAQRISQLYKEYNELIKNIVDQIIDSINWIVFSDTILITLPIRNYDAVYVMGQHLYFLVLSMVIQDKMFLSGLPLKGVINYGKFYVKDNFFAGKCIIEAYKLCKELELSACVLTDSTCQEIDKNILLINSMTKDNLSFRNVFFHNYPIPLKNGTTKLNTLIAHAWANKPPKDFYSMILDSFGSHNKDIPSSVNKKIKNTEQWLTYLAGKRDS